MIIKLNSKLYVVDIVISNLLLVKILNNSEKNLIKWHNIPIIIINERYANGVYNN